MHAMEQYVLRQNMELSDKWGDLIADGLDFQTWGR